MPERVPIPESPRGRDNRLNSAEFPSTVVSQIVHDVLSEQLGQSLECTVIHEMPVKSQEFMNCQPVTKR
jgi:hypothetical protein